MSSISDIYKSDPERAKNLLSQTSTSVDWGTRKVTVAGVDYGSIDDVANEVLKKGASKGTEVDFEICQKLRAFYKQDSCEARDRGPSVPFKEEIHTPSDIKKSKSFQLLEYSCAFQNKLHDDFIGQEIRSVSSSPTDNIQTNPLSEGQVKKWFRSIFRRQSQEIAPQEALQPTLEQNRFLEDLKTGQIVVLESSDAPIDAQKKFDEGVSNAKEKADLIVPLIGCQDPSITVQRVFLDTMVRGIFIQAIGSNEDEIKNKYDQLPQSIRDQVSLESVKECVTKIEDSGLEISLCEEELTRLSSMFLSNLSIELGDDRNHLVANVANCLEQSFMSSLNQALAVNFEENAKFKLIKGLYVVVPPKGSTDQVVVRHIIEVFKDYRIMKGELLEAGTANRNLPFAIKMTLEIGFSPLKGEQVQSYRIIAEKLTREPVDQTSYPIVSKDSQ